jgi:hypothetical protein
MQENTLFANITAGGTYNNQLAFRKLQGNKPSGRGHSADRKASNKNPIFFYCFTATVDQGLLIVADSRSRSDTPHSAGLPGRVISPSQGPLLDNTQHSQETNIHASGRIPNLNPSKRRVEDIRLRLRGHWDRPS